MKRNKLFSLFFLVSALFITTGCHQETGTENPSDSILPSETPSVSETDPVIEIDEIVVDQESISLYVGDSTELSFEVLPANATNKKVKFTSSHPEICTVDEKGTITAISEGETVITVEPFIEQESKISSSISVTVMRKVQPESLEVNFPSDVIKETEELPDHTIIEKYILETEKEYALSTIITPQNSSYQEVIYTIEPEKEDYLMIENNTLKTFNRQYIRIKIEAQIRSTDIKTVFYVMITTPKDIIDAKLQKIEETTKKKELESGVSSSVHIQKLNSLSSVTSDETITSTLYKDEVYDVKKAQKESYEYVKRRKIIDSELVSLTWDSKETEITSAEVKTIGTEITSEEAKRQSSLMYYDKCYGVGEIIFDNFLGREDEMGAADALEHYKVAQNGNTITITSNYRLGDVYYTYYYSGTITLNFSDTYVIQSAVYESKSFGTSNPFDPDTNEILPGKKPSTTMRYELALTLGEKVENDHPLDISKYYFTDFNASFVNKNPQYQDYYVGQTYQLSVDTFSPENASDLLDSIKITGVKDISGQNVLSFTEDSITILNSGTAEITVASKKVEKKYIVETKELLPSSIEIRYYGKTSLKPGETSSLIYAKVLPEDSVDTSYDLTIIEGEIAAFLTFDEMDEGYYLTANADVKEKTTVVIQAEAKTNDVDGNKIIATLEFVIVPELSKEEIEGLLIATTWYYQDEDGEYICTFTEDHQGTYKDDYYMITVTFHWEVQEDKTIVLTNQSTEGEESYTIDKMTLNDIGTELKIDIGYLSNTLSPR